MVKHAPLFLTAVSLLISCRNSGQKIVLPEKVYSDGYQKITTIYKENVYDLSGYADEGKGDPYMLFDENAYVDPRSGSNDANGYVPQTDPQPHYNPDIYFPLNRGNRIVVDLQIPYQLSEVYLYDRATDLDSVYIYTGNMKHWMLKVAFETKSIFALSGWEKFSLRDTSRYLMIQFNSPKCAITEMVLYGKPDGAIPHHLAQKPDEVLFTKKPMNEFLGVNIYNETQSMWLRPFYYRRIYSYCGIFDNDTTHQYPHVKYNMLRLGYWDNAIKDYYFFAEQLKRQIGGETWHTIMGLPLWMSKKGFQNKGRPVTNRGMDPADPASYARHANMMWNIAAFFGTTKVDTNLLSISNSPKSSGRGDMTLYENGNEDDANWAGSPYCDPVEYFAQSCADYDGNERTMGTRCGIKNADASSKMITNGLIELDTNRIRVYQFLCNTLRADKKFIWEGAIQYHHYSQAGQVVAITPEEDSLRWRLARVRQATYRLEPRVPCILGENGYDKNQRSRQGTPVLPGLSPEQSQGIFILRSINATAFSGFDAYILYWLKDYLPPENPGVYLTSGIIREMPDGSIKPYEAWFYVNTFESRLASYVPDNIVRESGSVWVYKYRNARSADSVAYFVYCPTRNGSALPGYHLEVGKTAGSRALEVNFADEAETGITEERRISSGVVTINVEERPKLIFVKETR